MEGPGPGLPTAVPTLLVAVQIDNLLQADGHGVVPVDTERGGRAGPAGCLPTSSWEGPRGPEDHTQGLLYPSHRDPLVPNMCYHSLPRSYVPFFGPHFLRTPSSTAPSSHG